MPSLRRRLQQPSPVPPQVELPPDFPEIPPEVLERFPSARNWQAELTDFWTRAKQSIQSAQTQAANYANARVVYNVDQFLIYAKEGIPQPMFALDSTGIKLGDVLVINTPERKIYIGEGIFADDSTPFYVDTEGNFSLGASLSWDAETDTLNITGTINATSGTIGGFEIGADYIRDTVNSMGLASTVTGGDDVRFWAGTTFANRALGPFYITEGGKLKTLNVGIGGDPVNAVALAIRGSGGVTGGIMWGAQNTYEITSDTTTSYRSFESFPSTEADAFTLANLPHFFARGVTIGAGSAITNQTGFLAGAGLNGATNNYGFRGQIAAAANTYNCYMEGTAENFFAGTVTGGGIIRSTDGTIIVSLLQDGAGAFVGTQSAHDLQVIRNGAAVGTFTATGLDSCVVGGVTPAALTATTIKGTSLAGVGTRTVVADAAGNLSAP